MRVLVMVLAFAAAAAAGEKKSKPAWEWTDEERIAVRVHPESIRERQRRLQAEAEELGPLPVAPLPAAEATLVVSGKHTPELFMPWELLNVLTHSVDSPSRRSRERFAAAIREAGWEPQTFWKTVKEVTGAYWRMELEALALSREIAKANPIDRRELTARLEKLQMDACAARADAVAAMDVRFGPRFRKFLYTAVAAELTRTSSFSSPAAEAARLRYLARGCR